MRLKQIVIKLIVIGILSLTFGCSTKDAFTYFKVDTREKLVLANTQSSRIVVDGENVGTLNVIYLNNVDKNISKDVENFFISIYTKEKNKKFSFELNGLKPIEVQKLYRENHYANILKENKQWNDFYLVSFKHEEKTMSLSLSFKEREKVASVNFLNY